MPAFTVRSLLPVSTETVRLPVVTVGASVPLATEALRFPVLTVRASLPLSIETVRLPVLTVSVSLPCSSVTVRLLWMSIVWSPGDFSSLPTSSVSLLRTTRLKSFWAWKKTSSASFLSSKRSSLNPLPPLLELLLIVDWVALAGRAAGGLLSPLYTRPVMIGRSGSLSRNSTITSCPIRGMNIPPQDLPAQTWATRTQQELFSLFVPSRSDRKSTRLNSRH